MPWWAALGCGIYIAHALWQLWQLLGISLRAAYFAIPFMLFKVAIALTATTFWIPPICARVTQLDELFLALPLMLSFAEARVMFGFLAEDIGKLQQHRFFYPIVAVQVLVSAVLPLLLLVLLFLMLYLKQCGHL